MNYKAVVQYDGTRYEGWQRHAGKETIQGKIEKALEKVIGQEVPIIGAGRTESISCEKKNVCISYPYQQSKGCILSSFYLAIWTHA